MGYAIAEELAHRGYSVDLVSGPSHLSISSSLINLIKVESAEEMYKASHKVFSKSVGAILSAAVADYKPRKSFSQKKKKEDGNPMSLDLVETKDIAKYLEIKINTVETHRSNVMKRRRAEEISATAIPIH